LGKLPDGADGGGDWIGDRSFLRDDADAGGYHDHGGCKPEANMRENPPRHGGA
jgi:hypothetical protein